jgi:hypothetical protein
MPAPMTPAAIGTILDARPGATVEQPGRRRLSHVDVLADAFGDGAGPGTATAAAPKPGDGSEP